MKCGHNEGKAANGRCRTCQNADMRRRRADAKAGKAPVYKPGPGMLGGEKKAEGMTPGWHVGKVTVQVGPDGVEREWIRAMPDAERRLEALLEACAAMKDRIPLAEPIAAPEHCVDDLLAVYPMGDPHVGMYAWGDETGASFDLQIAERVHVAAVDHLVSLAPPASQALILNVGDFFHADNPTNRTPKSGHLLDVDTRWRKVLEVGIRTECRMIDRALQRHDRVTVINVPGNHDETSAHVLSIALEHHYANNPRVTVDPSPAAFRYFRFGDCLIGSTHGNRTKAQDLESIMAHDRPQDWAATVGRRHWYTGHVHHDTVKECRNCTVETVRTLAARDAWHAAEGYRSGRDMKLDIWHATRGRINRHIVGIEDLT